MVRSWDSGQEKELGLLRCMQEIRLRGKERNSFMLSIFENLEDVDRVTREVIRWALMKTGMKKYSTTVSVPWYEKCIKY